MAENTIVDIRDVCFKLLDFKVCDEEIQEDEDGYEPDEINKRFLIQIYGLDETGDK
jgi:hypothetical protein